MALREEIQKKIDKKHGEIEALEGQIRDAKVYVQALEDTLRMVPREANEDGIEAIAGSTLRPGSKADRARTVIRTAGRSLHIGELLKGVGITNTPDERAALAGSLSSYARKGVIFTRPAPNTFGLLELRPRATQTATNGPPPNFGVDPQVNSADDKPFGEDSASAVDDDWVDADMDEEGLKVPVTKRAPF